MCLVSDPGSLKLLNSNFLFKKCIFYGANNCIFNTSHYKRTNYFLFCKGLIFYLEKMVSNNPTSFSLFCTICSFNEAKYSFILAFRILFSSQVWASVFFNRILNSCLKPVVLCPWAPLGQCSATSSWDWVEQTSVRLHCSDCYPAAAHCPGPVSFLASQETAAQLLSFFFLLFVCLCVCVCVCVFVGSLSKTSNWFAFLCKFLDAFEEPRYVRRQKYCFC